MKRDGPVYLTHKWPYIPSFCYKTQSLKVLKAFFKYKK